MSLDKMIILIGEESPSKISLLEQLRSDYNLYIPKRITTNSEYDAYPSLYQVVSEENISSYFDQGIVKSIAYSNKGISFNTSNEIGKGIAELYNGNIPGMVLNVDTTELGYYLKMYPTASILGYATEMEEMEPFKEILPDIITKEKEGITKILSYLNARDNNKNYRI